MKRIKTQNSVFTQECSLTFPWPPYHQAVTVLCTSFCASCCCLVSKLCPTLCDLMDCSPPGSSVHGILQARMLEWDAISHPLKGISLIQGSNWLLLHWQADFLLLSHQESPISCLPIWDKPPSLTCNSPFNISHHGDLFYSKELDLDLQSTSAT